MELNANRLGEMLLEAGLIDQFQLESALSLQRNLGGQIGSALVKLGYLPEATILEYLEVQEKYARIPLEDIILSEEITQLLSFDKMLKLGVVPVEVKTINQEKTMRVAMSDPTRVDLIDTLQFTTGCRILPVLASEDEILQAIRSNMPKVQAPEPVADFAGTDMDNFHRGDLSTVDTQDPRLERLIDVLQQKGILSAYDVEKIKLG